MPKLTVLSLTAGLFVLLALSVEVASACSCMAPPPPAEARDQAGAVFSGTVTQIDDDEGRRKIVTLEIARIWKWPGQPARTVEVSTASNSAACGFPFEQGKEYLVYADRAGEDDAEAATFTTNLCTRTTLLADAKQDVEALGAGLTPEQIAEVAEQADEGGWRPGDNAATNPAHLVSVAFDHIFWLEGVEGASARDVVAMVVGMLAGRTMGQEGQTSVEVGRVEWDSQAGRLQLRSQEDKPALRLRRQLEGDQSAWLVVHEAILHAQDEHTLAVQWTHEIEAPPEHEALMRHGVVRGQARIHLPDQAIEYALEGEGLQMQGRFNGEPPSIQDAASDEQP
ncbi:MAG: hypothetical protein WD534_03330 [Phycisphaeraceae bacterium]